MNWASWTTHKPTYPNFTRTSKLTYLQPYDVTSHSHLAVVEYLWNSLIQYRHTFLSQLTNNYLLAGWNVSGCLKSETNLNIITKKSENRWQTNEKNKATRNRRPQKDKGRLTRGWPSPSPSCPNFFLESLELACHESIMRSVPAK